MAKIFIVRHAESLANTQGVYQGQSYDTDLSPLGQKQTRALVTRFANKKIDRVFTSPLKRTLQTAQRFNNVTIEPLLLETNHGKWEGKSKSQVQKLWPNLHERWLTAPSLTTFPGGEKFTQTLNRAVSWLKSTLHTPGVCIAVTHSNIIMCLLTYLNGEPLDNMWRYAMQPTAVTLVESHSPAKIIYFNDTSHLKGLQSNLTDHAL